jgi:hypothetical protein
MKSCCKYVEYNNKGLECFGPTEEILRCTSVFTLGFFHRLDCLAPLLFVFTSLHSLTVKKNKMHT